MIALQPERNVEFAAFLIRSHKLNRCRGQKDIQRPKLEKSSTAGPDKLTALAMSTTSIFISHETTR